MTKSNFPTGISATVLSRFWCNVFRKSFQTAFLYRNARPQEVDFHVSPSSVGPVYVSIAPPEYFRIDWRSAGYLVSHLMLRLEQVGIVAGDRVGLLAANSPEWVWCDLAIQSLGAITVPIYPGTSAESLGEILKDCGAKLLIHDSDLPSGFSGAVEKLAIERCFSDEPTYQHLKIGGDIAYEIFHGFKACSATRAKFLEIKRLFLAFVDGSRSEFLSSDDAVATIVYTPDDQGFLKGVKLTHLNLAAVIKGLEERGYRLSEIDSYLSYLPLSHVFERVNGVYMCIWFAVPMAFSSIAEFPKAVKKVRPTVLLGVPKVWRKFRDSSIRFLKQKSGFSKKLIEWAMSRKRRGLSGALADLIVYSRIRKELGGRVRFALVGGALSDRRVLEFFDLINVPLLEGYGLTQTAGGVVVNGIADNRIGTVGKAIPGLIVDIANGAESVAAGETGEIRLKGPMVFGGYWGREDLTASEIRDGWFYTGDVGKFDRDDYLVVYGRKDDVLISDSGKNVSGRKLLTALKSRPEIEDALLLGSGYKFISALIFVPGGVEPGDEGLANSSISKAMKAVNSTLESWESVRAWRVVPASRSEYLDSSGQLARELVLAKFSNLVYEIYQSPHR